MKNNKIRTSIMLDKEVIEFIHSLKHKNRKNVSAVVNGILKKELKKVLN